MFFYSSTCITFFAQNILFETFCIKITCSVEHWTGSSAKKLRYLTETWISVLNHLEKSTICKLLFLISIYHCVKSVQIRSFFWSVISRIRTEYGEILRIWPYSIGMREYRDQEKLLIWTLFKQYILFKMSTNFPLKLKISTRIVTWY